MYRQSIQFPVKDAALREDVHALGALIGETLRDQGGEEFFKLVEGDRLAAIQRREGDPADTGDLQQRTMGRSPSAATDLTRAFSIWFQAVNTAEKVHRVRRRREYLNDSSTAQPGGIADCIARLQRDGVTLEQALQLVASMRIEPVFTGHPTESTRRTILRKQQHIAQDLLDRLNPASTSTELDTLWARVRLEITSIWQTEEHPREGLTVVDEREHVLFYLIDILYRVVPLFYEEIEAALAKAFGVAPERLDVPSILHFGSWVGGDMDGNPDVHGKTIRETLHRHSQVIVSTYFAECGQLAESLSQSANRIGISAELARRIDSYSAILPGAQALAPARHDRMPYRMFFGQIGERLKATYEGRPNAYQSPDELLEDVGLAADSLIQNRGRHAGYFLVRRFMRRVRTFGFHLATLDVIQHAHVHDQVIAQGLGQADWPTLDPEERLRQLRDLLARDQGPTSAFDAVGRRCLWVFEATAQARHKFGGRAIGQYIVSGAQGPEDVLAVLLLARWADITDKRTGESPLDVVPFLESIDSLERAGDVLRALHHEPAYRRHLAARGNVQVVVIGYSDANKEGGIGASRWASAGGPDGAVGRGARGRHQGADLSRPRRHAGARRRPHRESGRGRAGRRHSRCAAFDRAGRSRQSELWLASHCHAHARAHIRIRGVGDRARRRKAADTGGTGGGDANHRRTQSHGVSRTDLRQRTVLRILSRDDASRRDRTHAHRVAPGGTRRRQRRPGAARHSMGVRLDAKPPHVARMVRLRQRPVGRLGAARR